VAKGVAHLHAHRIVHRDLKPHNILCAIPDESKNSIQFDIEDIRNGTQLNEFVLKISDMGLSKQLDRDEQSFSMAQSMGSMANLSAMNDAQSNANDANAHVGTVGWQAPELIISRRAFLDAAPSPSISAAEAQNSEGLEDPDSFSADDPTFSSVELPVSTSYQLSSSSSLPSFSSTPHAPSSSSSARHKRSRTQNVDIFSLGCIFYYVLVPGSHPFGAWHDRELNIIHNNMDISGLSNQHDALDLIQRMLQFDPLMRPSADQVHRHPFFWTTQVRLEFLIEISDRLEHEEPDSFLVLSIESNAFEIIGSSWDRRLHASLLDDIGRYRKYDKSSVRDLLRLIRNKKHHFHELDDQLKALMTPIPQGFFNYFDSRFPKLLMHCVRVACTHLASEKHFSNLCEGISMIFDDRTNASAISNGNKELIGTTSVVSEASSPIISYPSSMKNDSSSLPASDKYVSSTASPANTQESAKSSVEISAAVAMSSIDQNVVVWFGSALAEKSRCKGWMRDASSWIAGMKFGSSLKAQSKPRPNHLTKASTDFRYRSRLCTHWEMTGGISCPMRKKVSSKLLSRACYPHLIVLTCDRANVISRMVHWSCGSKRRGEISGGRYLPITLCLPTQLSQEARTS
jgi:serine/threonine protein kinase